MSARFGELLGGLVPLTSQDVSEILEEQNMSHRRFGQIALSWGLCEPQHVWQAWCEQLAQSPEQVDLDASGIDSQALACMPADVARRFGAIPVRGLGDWLIVAVGADALEQASQHLPRLLKKRVQFVIASDSQVAQRIEEAYGRSHRGVDRPEPLKRTA